MLISAIFILLKKRNAIKPKIDATITNAKLLDMPDKLGQIAPGFYADIIATDDDPLENIATMRDVKFVMKNGVIYKD